MAKYAVIFYSEADGLVAALDFEADNPFMALALARSATDYGDEVNSADVVNVETDRTLTFTWAVK